MNNHTNNLMIICQKKKILMNFLVRLLFYNFISKNLEFISGLKYIFVIEMFNKGLHVVIELSKSKSVLNYIIITINILSNKCQVRYSIKVQKLAICWMTKI